MTRTMHPRRIHTATADTRRRNVVLMRGSILVLAVTALVVAPAGPAWAHGVGGRSDLPLPVWLFAYGAGGAVIVSFTALGVLWPTSRLERGIRGPLLPRAIDRAARGLAVAARVVGLALFAVVLWAALAGDSDATFNLAPVAIYVALWVGVQVLTALIGDVWAAASPFDTIAAGASWVRSRLTHRERGRRPAPDWGYWPATVGLFGFVWMELVSVDPASPRALAVAMLVYSTLVLGGAARWGRDWLRRGETFAAWFGLVAHLAPFHRDHSGRLRMRPPLAGLVDLPRDRGLAALVVVALGSTSFDGLGRTQLWSDIVGSRTGWDAVPLNTVGLLWMIGVVAAAYLGSMRVAARLTSRDPEELARWFLHSLVPIAFAYVVAHYFSLLVFEGQSFIRLLSDPLGREWDLLGTAGWIINYGAVSTATIAWVQAGAIVVGHVAGVLVAHDRAVARLPEAVAVRSQYPLLGAMVLYTVGGLALLMGA